MGRPAAAPARRAVTYLRVSTKDQATRGGLAEGLSIPAQRLAVNDKAGALGAVVVREFVDAGESAKSADRPELQSLLDYIRANQIDLVIVHKIDRLARNRLDDVTINLAIREAGARLVSVTENVDETPQGQLVHGIFSSVAEFYSRNLAQEVVKGMEEKVRRGGTATRAPLGYLNVRTQLSSGESREVLVDPDRAEHIQWAFTTYAADPDMSIARLTELLQDRGLTIRETPTHPERPVHRSHVHRMLTNRYYLGYVTWRGVEYQGTHQPLVDEATFRSVQERLSSNRAGGNRERKHLHHLSGALYCNRCQSRMLYMVTTGRRGGRYEYFVCAGRHTKSNECRAPFVAADRIEDAVDRLWDAEHARWKAEALPQLRQRLNDHLRSLRDSAQRDAGGLQKRIEKARRDRYKWADHAMAGTVPPDIAREKQEQLARQLAALESELETLQRACVDTEATLDAVINRLAEPGRTYRALTAADKRRYNQAWYVKILIDTPEDEADQTMATGFRAILGEALEGARQAIAFEAASDTVAETVQPGSEEPGCSVVLPIPQVRGLSKTPWVELRVLSLRTSARDVSRHLQDQRPLGWAGVESQAHHHRDHPLGHLPGRGRPPVRHFTSHGLAVDEALPSRRRSRVRATVTPARPQPRSDPYGRGAGRSGRA